jgi:hypothetical protein
MFTIILIGLGCAGKPRPQIEPFGGGVEIPPESVREYLALDDDPLDGYGANLFLSFEGGFLEEDRLKINGQVLLAGRDYLRLTGAYGAFKKVFDLRVSGDRFQVLDHEANQLFRGRSDDLGAAEALGFAVRPVDLARLLRVGGDGPLDRAEITAVTRGGDSLRVDFRVPGDEAEWRAGYDVGNGSRLTSLERTVGDRVELRVVYDRFFRAAGRQVPKRVHVSRPSSDERLDIEVRSLKRMDPPAERFELSVPDGVEVIELSQP